MAQRTGAERFLASIAKSASAGVILALALWALALAGCGGGSSDQEASSASPASSTATTASADAGERGASGAEGPAGSDGAAQGSPQGQGGAGQGEGAPGAQSRGEGNKRGPRIAQPKGPRESAPTPQELANATVADMTLQSPAIIAAGGEPGSLAPTYTCDGKDSWPAFSWGGVPPNTAELVFYAMNVQPVQGKLFVDWAVAGLDPALEGIEAGKLPKGAILGTNGFGKRGYSLCPEGRGEIYMFAVYALPTRLDLRPGFDAREARSRVLDVSGNVGLLPALYAHS